MTVNSHIAESPAAASHRLYNLILLALAVWAAGYARVALGPLQETMRNALSLTDNQIAILQGPALGLSIMVGAVPVGLLVDRYCRVRLMLLFVALALVGSVATALTGSFAVLVAARCLVGLSATASLIAAFSLISDLYAPEQRGRATMVVTGGFELSSPVAFALGGALLVSYAGVDAWRHAMMAMTIPPIVLIILLVLGMREPARTGQASRKPPVRAAFVELWRYRALVLPLLTARMMVGVADGATLIWAAPFLTRTFNLPPDQVGGIMATVLLIAGIAAPILGGMLADITYRSGGSRRTVLALSGIALLSLPAGLFTLTSNVTVASVLLIVFITLGFMTNIAAATVSTIVIPNEVRGTFLSISMVVGAFFGVALAPVLVSALPSVVGGDFTLGQSLAWVCILSSLLGAITFAFAHRYFPRAAVT